jgi:glyoxylase-like metal-dependent hydrolase (beta-lactamase superfamily II)
LNNVELNWETVISDPFEENTYILWAEGSHECLIVDPGMDPASTSSTVRRLGLTPAAILNTHGHADHIAGNGHAKQEWPAAPLIIGHGDRAMLTDPQLNLSGPFGLPLISPDADRTVAENDRLELAGMVIDVYETPGHSRGHVIYVVRNTQPLVVLGGDMLMRGSIGRSDFPGGNHRDLIQSIHQKMFTLAEDASVLPGHGPETTIGVERKNNPYVALR